jgi:hypothetical protein
MSILPTQRTAEELAAVDRPMPIWLHAVYLGLLMFAFGAAGRIDMEEERRLSLQGYVEAHATVTTEADVGTERLQDVRYAEICR